MTNNPLALNAIHAGQRVFYVNPLDNKLPMPHEEWLDAGWYYDSLGDAIGPFETEVDARNAFIEDEEF
jgi:hypothetical protein